MIPCSSSQCPECSYSSTDFASLRSWADSGLVTHQISCWAVPGESALRSSSGCPVTSCSSLPQDWLSICSKTHDWHSRRTRQTSSLIWTAFLGTTAWSESSAFVLRRGPQGSSSRTQCVGSRCLEWASDSAFAQGCRLYSHAFSLYYHYPLKTCRQMK